MKKLNFILAALLSFALSVNLIAQNAPQAAGEGQIERILLSDFETDGFWRTYLGHTHGNANIMTFEGKPNDKTEVVNYPDGTANPNAKVMGVRAFFTERLKFTLKLVPHSPVQIPGIVKSLEIWVSGRQMPNTLYAVLRDAAGVIHHIPFQDESSSNHLTFTGWKQLKAIVPDSLRQKEYSHSRKPFVSLVGLDLDFYSFTTQSGEEYFMYLDDLTATVDMYSQQMRSEDDLHDNWW